jgi:hypothetical protein
MGFFNMRLIHYINENSYKIIRIANPDEAIKILKKDCSKYLKETKGHWFYRGMPQRIDNYSLGYKTIRKDRKSHGMSNELSKVLNKWLEKHGHVRRDKAAIMTSSFTHAEFFSLPKTCFIQGNYNYTWIDGGDINQSDYKKDNKKWYGLIVTDYFNAIDNRPVMGSEYLRKKYNNDQKKMSEWIIENFEKYFHTNEKILTAYRNQYEIWFEAKGFYFIKVDGELDYYLRDYLK